MARQPAKRQPAPLPVTAIDFAGDHWVTVLGTPEEVADALRHGLLNQPSLAVVFKTTDGRDVYVFADKVRLVAVPAP